LPAALRGPRLFRPLRRLAATLRADVMRPATLHSYDLFGLLPLGGGR
jgi:hypothetical protein